MSKIDELIQKLCPNGVEWKTLEELGVFLGGLTGKSKDDFKDGNANFITYMNVFSNPGLNLHDDAKVKIADRENQRRLEYGDIIFTGSSETAEECAYTSVVCEVPEEDYYLNSFCFILRLYNVNLFNPHFLKHLFRSSNLRNQLAKTANGVTRFNVSKEKMKKIRIPVPPMEVQCEIVHILDQFTLLTAELTAELTARKQQYDYYRDELFVFDTKPDSAQLFKIKDICTRICSGGTPNTSNRKYYDGNIPWLRTQEVNFGPITDTDVKITEEGLNASSAKWVNKNAVIVAMYGATVGKVAYTNIALTTNQACCNLEIDDKKAVYKYVYYYLASKYEYIKSLGQGSQTNINADIVKNLDIFLPNLEEQQRIVDILDKFDAYCNDLTQGLPAEIELRKQQYEYYRDKLLSFKELK